ncbi:MAG: DNA gyrase/topoisomerase IV subunit A, partial [Bacteroidota bacterium]
DTQGNWGNIYTGDSAAAPRYIEARLSKFALEVLFNAKTTVWQLSYDGRNQEPVTLPAKFPLLLAQGVEGIAVGLACKILPHNFIELIEGSIDIIRGKKTNILPDFITGGTADFSKYNEGLRGGKVRVRARISKKDKKTLVIKDIPFGTTTVSLIDSILTANEKGKIKIKKVEDNTSNVVEIVIHLHPDSSEDLDKTIDALYAFTDCEVSISPNACIIKDDRPMFISVNEILKICTDNTVQLLKRELEIERDELEEDWHFSSLEKIFIEKRIYRDIEECETWEAVIAAIDKGLRPYRKLLHRDYTEEDIVALTEIKIKRISKFDVKKADEHIRGIEEKLLQVEHHLNNLKEYAINWYKNLGKKYGKGRERKTEISTFETINAIEVVVANQKLYVNREEGFAGYGMKKDEYVCDCSDIDDIIAFCKDGTMRVVKVMDKTYVGKDVLYINVFRKGDENTTYNMVYQDGPKGNIMIKRFTVEGITRDKEYVLTKGTKGSKVIYFTVRPDANGDIITIHHRPKPRLRNLIFDFDLNDIEVRGRNSIGNILTRNPVAKIVRKRDQTGVGSSVNEEPESEMTLEDKLTEQPTEQQQIKPLSDLLEKKIKKPKDGDEEPPQMSLF